MKTVLTEIVVFVNQFLWRLVVQIGAVDTQRIQVGNVMAPYLKTILPTPLLNPENLAVPCIE